MAAKLSQLHLSTGKTILLITFYLGIVGVFAFLKTGAVPSRAANLTPTNTPTATLVPDLNQFLSRYHSLEDLTNRFWSTSFFKNEEVNGLQPGEFNASPLVAWNQKTGDCFELAALAALFGQEKYGYTPYILIFVPLSFTDPTDHGIYVFQDPASTYWGYIDSLKEYHRPSFIDVYLLARDFIYNHPIPSGSYGTWLLVDLSKTSGNGFDWRTTTTSIPLDQTDIVSHDNYIGP